MVAVLGISASSRTNLLAELDALGTNLLTVEAGQTLIGDDAKLPEEAPGMISRIGPVQATAATDPGVDHRAAHRPHPRRGDRRHRRAGRPAQPGLDPQGHAAAGRFLDAATGRYPAVVLGSVAAERLGIDRVGGRVWLGRPLVHGHRDPRRRAAGAGDRPLGADRLPGGRGAPRRRLGLPPAPSTCGRTRPRSTPSGRCWPRRRTPATPRRCKVSRPSDALAARGAADTAFTGLLLGLGAVALIVGGVGVANVMVVSVLERRPEIGLRRALGATRGDVRRQFLAESLLLSGAGGLGGVAIGAAITAAYAASRSWGVAVPVPALAGAMGAALLIGAVAGLYPALRAARLAPTDALRT